MKKHKIAIFTSLRMIPAHPRLMMEKEILIDDADSVEIVSAPYSKKEVPLKFKLLNYLTLSFFRWDLIFFFKKERNNFDVNIIYDLNLLPLGLFFKKDDKGILIYETIDDNVHLTMYNLIKIFPLFNLVKYPILYFLKKIEVILVEKYYDALIVNSRYLFDLLAVTKTKIINYYSSPFENIELINTGSIGKPALLYLRIFSNEKGANKILELRNRLNLPLYIFGEVRIENFEMHESIFQFPRLEVETLKTRLIEISKERKFIGLSLIEPTNLSYANQLANKDIDYLCLGIPIIGNYRNTTREFIEAKCGVFYDQNDQIELLIHNDKYYNSMSKTCKAFYASNFRYELFKNNLVSLIDNLTQSIAKNNVFS